MSEYTTIKILKDTHYILRIIAAIRGEPMLSILDEFAKSEADRLGVKKPLPEFLTEREAGGEDQRE